MLGDNRAAALFNHVRALEKLQEAVDDARGDYNERKALCKEDGFDTTVVAAILKRRKNGEGQTQAFDELLREYENAIAEQKNLPFDRRLEASLRAGGHDVTVSIGPTERAPDPAPATEPLFDDAPAVDRFENEGGKTDAETPVGASEKDPF